MPWYWTDDLAHTLIEAGRVERSSVQSWISTPVAIRRDDDSLEAIGEGLLEDESEGPSREAALAA